MQCLQTERRRLADSTAGPAAGHAAGGAGNRRSTRRQLPVYSVTRMGRPRRLSCKSCGGHLDQVGPLSARGKCEACGVAGVEQAVTAMFTGSGPLYDKWATNTARGLERAIERARRRADEPG